MGQCAGCEVYQPRSAAGGCRPPRAAAGPRRSLPHSPGRAGPGWNPGVAHLLACAAGCSAPRWKGKRKSSLLPRLPELTRITLMGLVLSPMPAHRGTVRYGTVQYSTARLGAARPAGRPPGTAGFRFRCYQRPGRGDRLQAGGAGTEQWGFRLRAELRRLTTSINPAPRSRVPSTAQCPQFSPAPHTPTPCPALPFVNPVSPIQTSSSMDTAPCSTHFQFIPVLHVATARSAQCPQHGPAPPVQHGGAATALAPELQCRGCLGLLIAIVLYGSFVAFQSFQTFTSPEFY